MLNDILNTNINELIIVTERSILSFILLFLIAKIIGKKQVSELSLFDYVVSISIGNFAAEIAMNPNVQILNGVVGLTIFGVIAFLVAILSIKSIILRRFFMGTPTIIMQDGKFIYESFKKVKIDMNDFLEAARGKGYFDINEIKYAIMEADGKISFMPKEENKPVTIKDMNLKAQKQGLLVNAIIDGKIINKNLLNINKDEAWLKKELKQKGYDNYDNILLATIDINEKVCVYKKNNDINVRSVLE